MYVLCVCVLYACDLTILFVLRSSAMFATAIAGGVGLFKFYKPNSNPTIRFARGIVILDELRDMCV